MANNGQTWYFAISNDEVYYCRQLSVEEVESLKKRIRFDPNRSLADNLKNNFWVYLEEVGTGILAKAEGRALPDLRRYNNFVYYDFKAFNKSYSVDIFNDSEAEWFEVVWIPQEKLTEIFTDSLRLFNPKSDYHLQLAKLWRLVALVSSWVLAVIIVFVFVISSENVKIYDQTQNLALVSGSELVFKDIVIDTPNQTYELILKAALPADSGVSMSIIFVDSAAQVVSTGNVELAAASGFERTNSSSFYASKKDIYSLIVRLDDFGKVGVPAEQDTSLSATKDSLPIRLEVYKIKITADQGWYITGFGIVLLIIFARYRKKKERGKSLEIL